MSNADLLARYGGALMNTFGTPTRVLVRGEGPYVWDADGVRYLDLLGGIAVNALGHAHPRLVAAIAEQAATLGHVSNLFTSPQQIELAEKLDALVAGDSGLPARVFFTNSGTEANEAALKATRRTGRPLQSLTSALPQLPRVLAPGPQPHSSRSQKLTWSPGCGC